MITLKNYAVAFLRNGDKYLLIKRADNRKINPGIWSGIGGHIEPHEINTPLEACYREIEEETGITHDKISSLDLQYIITRRSGSEIRQSYIYFGKTDVIDLAQTDEGVLFWVPNDGLLNHEYTTTYTSMLEHYAKRKPSDTAIYVGVAENADSDLRMNWSLL